MKPVSIHDARKFAQKVGAKGVVVIVVDGSQFGWTSWGRGKQECGQMELFAEELMKPVENGTLDPWDAKGTVRFF